MVAPRPNVPSCLTGKDVTVKVVLSIALPVDISACSQSAGIVIGAPTALGAVNFELLTLGDVVVDSKSGASLEQTWTNAELVAALGSETSFRVRVTHVRDSFTSLPAVVTVTKF